MLGPAEQNGRLRNVYRLENFLGGLAASTSGTGIEVGLRRQTSECLIEKFAQ